MKDEISDDVRNKIISEMAKTIMRKPAKVIPEPNVYPNRKKKKSPIERYRGQFPITDYHDFTHRGTSKEKREQLNVGDIYVNAVICAHCDYFIRSRNKHDMVTCKCGKTSVDGGSWYQKATVGAIPIREMYYDCEKENIEVEKSNSKSIVEQAVQAKKRTKQEKVQ